METETNTAVVTPIKTPRRGVEVINKRGHAVSINGYHTDSMLVHLLWHQDQRVNQYCTPECAAKFADHRNSPANCDRMRRRIPTLLKWLLERNYFLVVEYDASPAGHGKIKAFKLYTRADAQEQRYAREQIERLVKRRKLSEHLAERAMRIIGEVCLNEGEVR